MVAAFIFWGRIADEIRAANLHEIGCREGAIGLSRQGRPGPTCGWSATSSRSLASLFTQLLGPLARGPVICRLTAKKRRDSRTAGDVVARRISRNYRPQYATQAVPYQVLNQHLWSFVVAGADARRPLPARVDRVILLV